MKIQNSLDSISQKLADIISQLIPGLPADFIRLGGAIVLGFLALTLLILALRLMRSGNRNSPSRRINVPRSIQQEGVAVDVMNSAGDDIAVRCVFTSVSSGKIKCEIIERLDTIKTEEGQDMTCVFAPMKTDDGKVNTFTAQLLETDTSGRNTGRIVLSAPSAYGMMARRKHVRKRVADQQFIRVKLWVADPHSSDISFEDAAPHIGVNSFMPDGHEQAANAVVNISHGGIGLSVQNRVIPETCAAGAQVAINLFMFNFKKKSFKPYWYSGEIRSMQEGRPGFTRIGIEFNGVGENCEDSCALKWDKF